MDILSVLAGLDNLKRVAVILGIFLMGFGALYPLQKSQELEEKQITFDEYHRLDSLEIKNLDSAVRVFSIVKTAHDLKLKKLCHERDSLSVLKLNDDIKFKLTALESKIDNLQKNDEAGIKDLKNNLLQLEKTQIKKTTLEKEITNLESYISKYKVVEWIALIVGLLMFIYGVIKWISSDKKADSSRTLESDIRKLEHEVKKEELKKLQRDSGQTP